MAVHGKRLDGILCCWKVCTIVTLMAFMRMRIEEKTVFIVEQCIVFLHVVQSCATCIRTTEPPGPSYSNEAP